MNIPLYSILIIYFLVAIAYLIFIFLHFKRLKQTRTLSSASLSFTAVIILITLLNFALTFTALKNIDWQQPLFDFGGTSGDILNY